MDSSDNEENEGDEAVSQLVLNKRQNRVLLVVEPEVPTLPISISSSDNEHSDNLAYAPPQSMKEVEIIHSFREANDSDVSSNETNKFQNMS